MTQLRDRPCDTNEAGLCVLVDSGQCGASPRLSASDTVETFSVRFPQDGTAALLIIPLLPSLSVAPPSDHNNTLHSSSLPLMLDEFLCVANIHLWCVLIVRRQDKS